MLYLMAQPKSHLPGTWFPMGASGQSHLGTLSRTRDSFNLRGCPVYTGFRLAQESESPSILEKEALVIQGPLLPP